MLEDFLELLLRLWGKGKRVVSYNDIVRLALYHNFNVFTTLSYIRRAVRKGYLRPINNTRESSWGFPIRSTKFIINRRSIEYHLKLYRRV